MTVEHLIAMALATIGEGAPPPLPDPVPPDFWPGFVAGAIRTNSLPLLAPGLAADRTGRVPRWVVRVAEVMHAEVLHRSASLLDTAGTLSERLRSAGVRFAVRKGLHVVDLYEEVGGRPIGDIDVLVSSEHAVQATAISKALGFTETPMTRAQRIWMSLATNNLPPLEHRPYADGPALGLDFTTSLTLPVMREPPDDDRTARMLARTVLSRNGLLVLSPPDLLVDLMLNAYVIHTTLRYVGRLRFQRLFYYLDLLVAGRQLTRTELTVVRTELDNDTLRDGARFAIGNLRRLAPHAPTVAALATCVPPGDRDVLDLIGQWELETPYRWRESLTQRLTLDHVPTDLPAARALI